MKIEAQFAILGSDDESPVFATADEIAQRLRAVAGTGEVFAIVARTDVVGYWQSVLQRAHRELRRAAEHDPVRPLTRRVKVGAVAGAAA